jgi:hypothetical protein
MVRNWSLAILAALLVASAARAQATPWRFHWQPGQVLTYRVEQTTSAAEVVEGKKTETTSKLGSTKRWQVLGVDAARVATVQLSMTALRLETSTPSGEVMVFDSADLPKSNPHLREELSKFLNQPLAVLRVDDQGRVVEVKECRFGPASRYESEPPFVLTLGGEGRSSWERAYKITLDPPQGTGEKYDAVQRYAVAASKGATAVISIKTILKSQPEAVADQAPLLQMQPEGEIVFDWQKGTVESVRLRIDKELKGHQGEGSSYRFQSTLVEQSLGSGRAGQ